MLRQICRHVEEIAERMIHRCLGTFYLTWMGVGCGIRTEHRFVFYSAHSVIINQIHEPVSVHPTQ